jgi:hypothetical protein
MDLSLERWEGSTPAEREATARRLAGQLPAGFAFDSVRPYRLGEQEHQVALYQQEAATFALLPGGPATLGYAADRLWEPNPEEQESWQGTAEEYGIDKTIHQFVAEVTLRPRQAAFAPFLIETAAVELGWEPIGADEPEVKAILREHGAHRQVTMTCEGVSTRVRKGEDGSILAERSLARTHAELAAQLRATGFRFPTSDEWEYACGGGAPTLFRWGDHVPCDRYPSASKLTGTCTGDPTPSACSSPRTRTSTSWWRRSERRAAATADVPSVAGRLLHRLAHPGHGVF